MVGLLVMLVLVLVAGSAGVLSPQSHQEGLRPFPANQEWVCVGLEGLYGLKSYYNISNYTITFSTCKQGRPQHVYQQKWLLTVNSQVADSSTIISRILSSMVKQVVLGI